MPSPQGKSGHSQHPEKPFSRQHVRWRHKQESSASVLSRQPLQDGLPHRAQTSPHGAMLRAMRPMYSGSDMLGILLYYK